MDADVEASLLSEVADHKDRIDNLERVVADLLGKQVNLTAAIRLILTAAKVEHDKLKEEDPNGANSTTVPGGLYPSSSGIDPRALEGSGSEASAPAVD